MYPYELIYFLVVESIHIVVCVYHLFLLNAEQYSMVWMLKDTLVVSSLGLQIRLL